MTYKFNIGDRVKIVMVDSRWEHYTNDDPAKIGTVDDVLYTDADGDVWLKDLDEAFPWHWLEIAKSADINKSEEQNLLFDVNDIISKLERVQEGVCNLDGVSIRSLSDVTDKLYDEIMDIIVALKDAS